MADTNIKAGEPFYFGMIDSNLDGTLDNFNVDGHPGLFECEADAIDALSECVEDHRNYGGTIYYCVAIARVESVPRVKVKRLQSERTGA